MFGQGEHQMPYSKASADILGREMLPGILAASFQEPLDLDWIKQIVQHGVDMGLPMKEIYEKKRNNAINSRSIVVPSLDRLMPELMVEPKNPIDELFESQ